MRWRSFWASRWAKNELRGTTWGKSFGIIHAFSMIGSVSDRKVSDFAFDFVKTDGGKGRCFCMKALPSDAAPSLLRNGRRELLPRFCLLPCCQWTCHILAFEASCSTVSLLKSFGRASVLDLPNFGRIKTMSLRAHLVLSMIMGPAN